MRYFSILCCLFIGLPIFVLSQPLPAEKIAEIQWSNPELINPFQPNIGDFLDVNLDSLLSKAYGDYQAGKYEEAAKYYLALLHYDISDANSIYNLACCYGLLGKDTLAAEYLARSVKAGFEDIGHIEQDPDFDKVRKSPVFVTVMDTVTALAKRKQADLGIVTFVEAPTILNCRVHLPDNYDSTRSYPLVIGLHGFGSNNDQFITLWKRFGNPDLIYAAPQAPYALFPGKEIGYSWAGAQPVDKIARELSENYIAEVARSLTKQYKTTGTYLFGFSQGAAYTYTTGIKNPDLFKGLICFGGWLDTSWLTPAKIKAAKNLKVFIGHGKQDRMVEYQAGITSRDILKADGFKVTFKDFAGGHAVPEEVLKQVKGWMEKK
jgi:phospholipase/carboxylesterase